MSLEEEEEDALPVTVLGQAQQAAGLLGLHQVRSQGRLAYVKLRNPQAMDKARHEARLMSFVRGRGEPAPDEGRRRRPRRGVKWHQGWQV